MNYQRPTDEEFSTAKVGQILSSYKEDQIVTEVTEDYVVLHNNRLDCDTLFIKSYPRFNITNFIEPMTPEVIETFIKEKKEILSKELIFSYEGGKFLSRNEMIDFLEKEEVYGEKKIVDSLGFIYSGRDRNTLISKI